MITVGIAGAAGKMGQALVRAVAAHPQLSLAAAWERSGEAHVGQDAGVVAGVEALSVKIGDSPQAGLRACQVVIDFTAPEATLALLEAARAQRCALVIGTTGLSAEQTARLRAYGTDLPMVYATNFSLGVNVLWALARQAAAVLGPAFDAEIIEAHHNQKKDAPSGTAMRMAQIIAAALKRDLDKEAVYERKGMIGARTKTEIGIQTVRAGDIVGEHWVIYGGLGERLEFIHRAHSRDNFAKGAVRAAKWIVDRPNGFYDMQDVLGLKK